MEVVSKSKKASPPVGDYLREGLLALVPYYKSGYKSVVLTRKSSYPDKRAVPWLVKTIARHFKMDINLMRKHSGRLLNRQTNFSLAFAQHLVLLPVKLNKTAAPNEIMTGYVSMGEVDWITGPPKAAGATTPWHSMIIFKNGRQLPAFNITSTLGNRMWDGKKILTDYLELNGDNTVKRTLSTEDLLKALPNCNCLLLDRFLAVLGLDKKPESLGDKVSLPAISPRLTPDLLQRKPGVNE